MITTELLPPKQAKVATVKCLKSLLFHTRYFFKRQYNRKFIIADYHKIIAKKLEEVLEGKCKRLIIEAPPRYTKTEFIKSLMSHGLALNPSAKFIHLSYSDDLALDNSETVKNLIETDYYQQLFPEVKIKKDSKAKEKWYTTKGGGVLARAAAGQVTGFGAGIVPLSAEEQAEIEAKELEDFNKELDDFLASEGITTFDDPLSKKFLFGGAIIIDDPIKPEDADQDTIRVKVNNRFDSTIRNRVNSYDTPIIIIMQRLHPEDLAGYLQRDDEADKWEVLSFPAINQANNPHGLPVGEPLWPFKHTLEQLKALEKANEIVFARQYMQDPKAKAGLLFPIGELHFEDMDELEDILDDPDFCFCAADPADEGGDDFAGGDARLVGDKIYIKNILYNEDGADFNEKAFYEMILNANADEVGVEGVFGWKETSDRIREMLDDAEWEGDFRTLRPRQNKHSRILNRASFIRNHLIFRKDYQKYPQYWKFIRNLTSYLRIQEAGKKNKHDDAPDLCEMIAGYFERNFSHLWGHLKTKAK